jgi:hypothetical protein
MQYSMCNYYTYFLLKAIMRLFHLYELIYFVITRIKVNKNSLQDILYFMSKYTNFQYRL